MNKLFISLVILASLVLGFNVVSNEYRTEFRAWALNMEQEKADLVSSRIMVRGQEMAYLDNQKEAPVMVMLHGFSGSKDNWLRLAQALKDQYRVIAPDLMGHGENPIDLDGSYGISDQVEYLNDFLKAMDVSKVHLVGNSMGGAIASLYSARYPAQVASLILISPAGVHDVPSDLDKGLESGQNFLLAETEEEFYQVLDFVMSEPPFIPGAIAKAEAEIAVSRAPINKKIFKDIRSDMDTGLDKEFAKIAAPTLIIWGDQDRAIHVENIDKYALLISGSEKAVFEGIGHLAMIEVPNYTAERILAFLSK